MYRDFLKLLRILIKKNFRNKALMEIYLFKDNNILLVEGNGELDKEIYSRVLKQKSEKNIKIVNIGSKKNAKILLDLNKSKANIFAFLDKDNDEYIHNHKIGYTSYYSIESYFLCENRWKNIIPKKHHENFKKIYKKVLSQNIEKYQEFKIWFNKIKLDLSEVEKIVIKKNIKLKKLEIPIRYFNCVDSKDNNNSIIINDIFLKKLTSNVIDLIWKVLNKIVVRYS